ncbi:MAG: NUDIX domain-containing protein [Myxococcales bacterium]|nr:NUDIX domain-containing protein [Myxococcales bacterium]USN50404.1 MAG: NUDIX domain-containing protein [Myxococcales bacterium]
MSKNNAMKAKIPVRKSIRAILLNQSGEVLLLKADDPYTTTAEGHHRGPFWFLVGGKIEQGESEEQACLREIFEETGISSEMVKLGPVVWKSEISLVLNGTLTKIKQRFMITRTTSKTISLSHLSAQEKKVIKDARWFSLNALQNCEELIYPLGLRASMNDIFQGNYPIEPVEIEDT